MLASRFAPNSPVLRSDHPLSDNSAHRTAALQIEVARHPHVPMATLAHVMVQTVLRDAYTSDLPIGVSARVREDLETPAPDWPNSPTATALRELKRAWRTRLPQIAANSSKPCVRCRMKTSSSCSRYAWRPLSMS
jgi:ParB family chromosome partitioning protein